MDIVMIGTSYRYTPIAIREKCAIHSELFEQIVHDILHIRGIHESVILSTCNRTEFYLIVDSTTYHKSMLLREMKRWFNLNQAELDQMLELKGAEAVHHLFRVTAGLDAMVIGETQILGQVKRAYYTAHEQQLTGPILNRLFKQAITVAKRTHHQTGINNHALSLSSIAFHFINMHFQSDEPKRIIILGAGKMGKLTLQHISQNSSHHLTVINRDYLKAERIAQYCAADVQPYANLFKQLANADLLISTVTTVDPIITKQAIKQLQLKHQLVFIDLSLPRSIDASIAQLPYVELYDLDQLYQVVDQHQILRKEAALKMETIIETEVNTFLAEEEREQLLNPTLAALYQKVALIEEQTLTSLFNKLPALTERDQQVIQKHMHSVISQLIEQPVSQLKQADIAKDQMLLAYFNTIFQLTTNN
uniref:glutamyl-tRNA reductase n=1 Tax=Amphibacillus sediminis TaxID=360185 RepID=UPI00082F8849